jgi:tRNA threonylcarbamoyladenosine biosynthesis protein TsaB
MPFCVNTLAFDCSTSGGSAAVIDSGGHVLAAVALSAPVAQAEALLPLIETTLADSGLTWNDLGLIGVTVGPGSFTGLRIGLAAARGLALARGIPVVGVSTAEIFAHMTTATERTGRTLLVAIESKRSDLFVQVFSADLVPLSALSAVLPDAAMKLAQGPLLLVGDGADRLPTAVEGSVRAAARSTPDAIIVARRAACHFADGDGLPASPLYLRPPDVSPAPSPNMPVAQQSRATP